MREETYGPKKEAEDKVEAEKKKKEEEEAAKEEVEEKAADKKKKAKKVPVTDKVREAKDEL